MYTAGFIGIGNMGGALMTAAAKKLGSDFMVCDFDQKKVADAVEKYGCVSATAAHIARDCRYIFLGVKPQMAEDACRDLIVPLSEREDEPILVTMMAGLTTETVRKFCGGEYKVIRIMPNIAAAVGESMTLCTSTDNVKEEEMEKFLDFMSESGKFDRISEKLMDAGMALSGCGPAFVCLFIEALADGAVACGVPRKSAMEYAAQMILGTVTLMQETGKHPAVMKDEVCSPAGTTIAGVRALEENGFRSAAMDAVIAAFEKTKALK